MSSEIGEVVHRAEATDHRPPRIDALFSGAPTNQQIIDASKRAYAANQAAVDLLTLAVVASVAAPKLAGPLSKLDGTNWLSPGIPPTIVSPFLDSAEMRPAIEAAGAGPLKSASVGVFDPTLPTSSQPGMIGFAAPLDDLSSLSGLTLSLDIPSEIVSVGSGNLQYGLWISRPGDLHDNVLGMYVTTTLKGTSVALKILLDGQLKAYGFVASTGTTLPVTSAVFAGSTSQWSPA